MIHPIGPIGPIEMGHQATYCIFRAAVDTEAPTTTQERCLSQCRDGSGLAPR